MADASSLTAQSWQVHIANPPRLALSVLQTVPPIKLSVKTQDDFETGASLTPHWRGNHTSFHRTKALDVCHFISQLGTFLMLFPNMSLPLSSLDTAARFNSLMKEGDCEMERQEREEITLASRIWTRAKGGEASRTWMEQRPIHGF